MSHSHVVSTDAVPFFDVNHVLLYVGVTGDPGARWRAHSNEKAWWREVVTVEVEHYDTRDEVEAAEALAIKSEGPLHNVLGGRAPRKPNRKAEIQGVVGGEWTYLARQRGLVLTPGSYETRGSVEIPIVALYTGGSHLSGSGGMRPDLVEMLVTPQRWAELREQARQWPPNSWPCKAAPYEPAARAA